VSQVSGKTEYTSIRAIHNLVPSIQWRCSPTIPNLQTGAWRLKCDICLKLTYTHIQPFYGCLDFVWDNQGELAPEETFTHSHLLQSSIIPYLLPPPTAIHTTSLFNLRASKSSLVYFLVWNPPIHTPYIYTPNHCLLFATHAHTNATCFAVVLRLCHLILVSLNSLLGTLSYLNATHPSDHSHL